jgi:hypothetical protein
MSEVSLSVLQVEGLQETDPGLRFEFFVEEERCGETYFYGGEGSLSLPAEGKFRIEMYGSEGFIADIKGDMRSISGRNRVWITVNPSLRLLLSAPALPSISEASETPRSEDNRDSFSQLTSRNLNLRVLELQSELDHEREKYSVNIEQFVTHHKAVQDRYRLVVESLEKKNEKTISVLEDVKAQLNMQVEIAKKAVENESIWKAKVEELTCNLQEAHNRFIEREKQFRLMLSEVGNQAKLLEDENHILKEQIVTYESRLFELTEVQKQLQLKDLHVETRARLCGRCLQARETIEELRAEVGRLSASEQNSFAKCAEETKSADRSVHSASKVPQQSKSPLAKRPKAHKASKSTEMVSLSSAQGVITVHAEGKDLPLADFLKQRSTTSEQFKAKRSVVVGPELHRRVITGGEQTITPGGKRCQLTVLLDEDSSRSRSCSFPKVKDRISPLSSVKAEVQTSPRPNPSL